MPYVKYTDFNYKLEVPKQLKQPQQFTVVLKRLCQYLLFVCLSIIETSHDEIYFFPGFAKKKKKGFLESVTMREKIIMYIM